MLGDNTRASFVIRIHIAHGSRKPLAQAFRRKFGSIRAFNAHPRRIATEFVFTHIFLFFTFVSNSLSEYWIFKKCWIVENNVYNNDAIDIVKTCFLNHELVFRN